MMMTDGDDRKVRERRREKQRRSEGQQERQRVRRVKEKRSERQTDSTRVRRGGQTAEGRDRNNYRSAGAVTDHAASSAGSGLVLGADRGGGRPSLQPPSTGAKRGGSRRDITAATTFVPATRRAAPPSALSVAVI